jgi:hypothetical protein
MPASTTATPPTQVNSPIGSPPRSTKANAADHSGTEAKMTCTEHGGMGELVSNHAQLLPGREAWQECVHWYALRRNTHARTPARPHGITCASAGGTTLCPLACKKAARAPGPSAEYTSRPHAAGSE